MAVSMQKRGYMRGILFFHILQILNFILGIRHLLAFMRHLKSAKSGCSYWGKQLNRLSTPGPQTTHPPRKGGHFYSDVR